MHSAVDLTARARIRDAALARFGAEGTAKASVRAIAADAGVSPALVLHHFGSKEALRRECDAHVVAAVRGRFDDTASQDPAGLANALEASTTVRRYLARALLDGSTAAAELFDEIVDAEANWLTDGEAAGAIQPASDPRGRAAIYVSWLLAPLTLAPHLARAFEVTDLTDTDATLRYAGIAVEMLTRGVFTDERALATWTAAAEKRGAR